MLVQRGIETYEDAKAFFRPELDKLHDPFLMRDMDKAINRITTAIERNERILIYGDYDVDGMCSTALLTRVLRAAGVRCDTRQVSAVQSHSSDMQVAYERGAVTDIAEVMLARQEAGVAFEATLQVRNKLLTAYQDIMRMGG